MDIVLICETWLKPEQKLKISRAGKLVLFVASYNLPNQVINCLDSRRSAELADHAFVSVDLNRKDRLWHCRPNNWNGTLLQAWLDQDDFFDVVAYRAYPL